MGCQGKAISVTSGVAGPRPCVEFLGSVETILQAVPVLVKAYQREHREKVEISKSTLALKLHLWATVFKWEVLQEQPDRRRTLQREPDVFARPAPTVCLPASSFEIHPIRTRNVALQIVRPQYI
uniref:AlNc14C276G10049 protein n=1 Tax=Albugo laibachii Nc14 TaxID=890382 RepID=F0WUP2_9STRA|nr:AlNc14C276G10049 [Albugo laibachii Nc14]|eukprot:CCA25123.1 AlNc14C276G10049 [Albugo laibachii Nc14]